MARGEWGYQGRGKLVSSWKKATLIVCSVNIVIALYVLRSLYSSLYIYSDSDSHSAIMYTPDQIRKMEESIRIRKEFRPVDLVKLVKESKAKLYTEEMEAALPLPLKQKIIDEILVRLRSLNASSNIFKQREAVESWRKEKLKAAKSSTVALEEYGILARALELDWSALSEEIGLWIPIEVINAEHDDKPEGVDELGDEILAGRPLPPECGAELHTDYGGVAVRRGITHHKESAADCCQACLDQAKRAQAGEKRCNIWVYCPAEAGCHSPDIYQHKFMECWLKCDENPKFNYKDRYPQSYRDSHPSAPLIVPWVSGVLSLGPVPVPIPIPVLELG